MNSTTLSATNKTENDKIIRKQDNLQKNVRIIQKLLTKYIDYIMMKSRKVMVK